MEVGRGDTGVYVCVFIGICVCVSTRVPVCDCERASLYASVPRLICATMGVH